MSAASACMESFMSMLANRLQVDQLSKNRIEITGIDVRSIQFILKRKYNVPGFQQKFFNLDGRATNWSRLVIHNFFVPELIYILHLVHDQIRSKIIKEHFDEAIEVITNNTWYKQITDFNESPADMNAVRSLMTKYPKDYQEEFVTQIYWQKKNQYRLNGYLLAMDVGTGKTATSMFVKEAFHIKHAVVICPLSLVRNVWQVEIEDNYKKPVNAWYIGDNPNDITNDTEYVVTNYEAIDKIYATVTKKFKPSETIFIVDESHNFKDIKAQRTKWLTDLCFAMRGTDILLLSGTPIKALQNECLPIFKLLDSFYDSEVEEQLKVLNRYPKIMNELLHNRLGLMMYRKTQDEVLTLPARHDLELKLSIRNGDKFTAHSIQKLVKDYSDERRDFYMTNYAEYEKQFKDCLHYYESHYVGPHNQAVWMKYLGAVEMIHGAQIKSGLAISKPMRELIQWVNQFDEQEIIPKLPFDLRKQFRASRTVYKYVELKIMGEVIGDLLNRLRVEMTEQLIGKEVVDIINNAEKKTILFASYTDALKMAEKVCKEAGMKPLVITGENSKDAKELVKKFKETRNLNPLIASIKVMSTGHTINEANTVIFLNVPFRDVDYQQASGRCWRLGQDTEVWVYKLVLDTGDEPNLSTRMQDILTWSKEQFGAIVDGEDISDLDPDVQAISKFLSNPTEQIFEFAKSLKQRITRIL